LIFIIFVKTAIKYDDNAIITGTVLDFYNPEIIQTTGSFFSDKRYLKEYYPYRSKNINNLKLDKDEKRDLIDDIFWLLPFKVFLKTGYYSSHYFLYSEQADYALSATKKGFELIYMPQAKLWHKGSITSGGGDKAAPHVVFWRNKSSIIYLYRNIKKRHFIFLITKKLIKQTTKSLFSLVKFKNPNNSFNALIGMFYGLAWIIHRKADNGYNPFLKNKK